MLDYVYGQNEIVAPFVAQLIPSVRERGFGNCMTIGVGEGGRLIAGFVYHDYYPEAQLIQISGAALPDARWCTQQTLAHVYRYPFLQLGCQMIFQIVPATDEPLLWLAIVTITEKEATANLRAPVVINPSKMIGCQLIRDNDQYPVRFAINLG